MKKFLGFFILTGLMFSADLFAAEASSSGARSLSGVASSSGGPEGSGGSVTLVTHGTKIKLSHEQVGFLDSRTIEAALAAGMAESTTREIELSEEFDAATVQTLADILAEIVKTGSFDKSVVRYVVRENGVSILELLDYLQAELLENIVFERLFELSLDLSDCKSAYYFLDNMAQTCPNVIDKVFTQQAISPNLRSEKILTGHTGLVSAVSWSPDGKSLASASSDHTVRVWNVANGESRTLPGHTDCVESIAWSPDGKSLASASDDHTVRVWNVATGESRALAGHTSCVLAVSWSPDGKSLASASCDNTVRVWNVATGGSRALAGHTITVRSIAWSPDGKSLASASCDQTVRVWNVANGESRELTEHTGYVESVSWSSDGKSLASASWDQTVRVWNVANGESRTLAGHTDRVLAVSWSPDGKSLASASWDQTVRVWNVATGESRALAGHTDLVRSIAWSPDGKSLASASWDQTVRVWNVANGESRTLTGHTMTVRAVSWSPDGKSLASASNDQTVRVWGNSELDACSPLQKLFILLNLPKKLGVRPGIFKRATLWFSKLFERVSLRVGDDEPIAQWLGVYQSLPEQAKRLLAKDVREKFERLMLSRDLSNKTGESVFREISSLMRTNKPASDVLSFFVAHEKKFGDRAEDILKDIKRYAAGQAKEHGDGASLSGSSSSASSSKDS